MSLTLSTVGCSPDATPQDLKIRTLSVLMPVYNERGTLAQIVDHVLQAPVSVDIELVIVDDCSTDGSWEVIERLAAADARIKAVRHARNQGKGAAIRTAIAHISGEVAVVQDADLEYDPADFAQLLQPILDGKADAVFGSRFLGHTRRAQGFWHRLINGGLTLCSNMLCNLSLTDMETCYKMIRSDVLRDLRLECRTFTFEPEVTARLAQWGARIYEVPVNYSARGFDEGKKIRATDGLRAIGAMLRAAVDRRFTDDATLRRLRVEEQNVQRARWIFELLRGDLGHRVLELSAERTRLTRWLAGREHLTAVVDGDARARRLQWRFAGRGNVAVEMAGANARRPEGWSQSQPDTIICEGPFTVPGGPHAYAERLFDTVAPGGACIVVLERTGRADDSATFDATRAALRGAGFDLVAARRFGSLDAWLERLGIRGDSLPALQWRDRLTPFAKWCERFFSEGSSSLVVVARKPKAAVERLAA